ncbi:MAG TPA: IS3 family transposase [Terriglobales bacterium]|jgi:putative transposase|nr:IS3 family transposase [Terriglobales bacterium]
MCHLAGVSRASYYRHWEAVAPDEAEMAVRAAIQEVVLRHRRRYGYRRVTEDLHRQGMVINHKRVSRIMREDNLLAIRYRKYILTTNSQHDCQVYLNLAARMTLTAVNQLWVADITYIRLRTEFVFLAVVIDRYSRKAIGWALDRSLTARVAVTALQQAINQRQPPPGVVHHSDQGTQYVSAEYAAVLGASRMIPSMSRPANPYDNAACESFMKTLKQEEIYCNQYADFDELSQHLEEFMGTYYNRLRLHSALGYRTPEEFERDAAAAPAGPGSTTHDAAVMTYFTPKEPEKSIIRPQGPIL